MTHGSDYVSPSIVDPGEANRGAQDRGLTKREYFAAMALQGLIPTFDMHGLKVEGLGLIAVQLSDYLIEALNQPPSERQAMCLGCGESYKRSSMTEVLSADGTKLYCPGCFEKRKRDGVVK